MIGAGFVIENPITRSRTVVLETDSGAGGSGWLLEARTAPHSRSDVPEHLHLTWTETFEIIEGTAFCSVDGVQRTFEAGCTVVVAPGQRHIHPWNAGETEMVYRQLDVFDPPDVDGVHEVLGVFATLADLARAGKVNKRGEPKNPLQLAVMLKTLNQHGGYDAKLPVVMQNLLGASLGSLAEMLGYTAISPRYRAG
jgi:mannose-6-phosphate isomerase-like protein (cupin superfamily)